MNRDTNFIHSAVAGAAAACAATVVFHPIDTVKTILQRDVASTATQVLRNSGARGLYIGVVPAGVSMAAACAVRMGAYEVLKEQLLGNNTLPLPSSPSARVALASGCSVVVSALVRSPLDMIKTQMQSGASTSVVSAVQTALTEGGVLGLYRGAHLALLRDVPFFSINLVLYERLRHERQQHRHGVSSVSETIVIGGLSQGFAGFVTNPIDVLKTRVQTGRANTFVEAFRSVMKDGGLATFMRGALMRTLWIAPQGCIYYPVYEYVQTSFR